MPSLSTGLLSATQGNYATAQLLLDVTQGARVSYSAYSQGKPPPLTLLPVGQPFPARDSQAATSSAVASTGAGGQVSPWSQVLRRAESAPQILQPGLLASAIPGGAAYAGTSGADHIDGLVAADRKGHVAAVSLGPAATLPARIGRLSRRYALVVADLPGGPGRRGAAALACWQPPA